MLTEDSHGVSVLLNQGDATFETGQRLFTADDPVALIAADLDGDGHPDLAVANEFSDNISVFLNDGEGTFVAAADLGVDLEGVATVADLDADGKVDLIAPKASTTVTDRFGNRLGVPADAVVLLSGNGDGTFAATELSVGTGPAAPAVADLASTTLFCRSAVDWPCLSATATGHFRTKRLSTCRGPMRWL